MAIPPLVHNHGYHHKEDDHVDEEVEIAQGCSGPVQRLAPGLRWTLTRAGTRSAEERQAAGYYREHRCRGPPKPWRSSTNAEDGEATQR